MSDLANTPGKDSSRSISSIEIIGMIKTQEQVHATKIDRLYHMLISKIESDQGEAAAVEKAFDELMLRAAQYLEKEDETD